MGSKGEAPEMSGESIRRETKAVVVGTTRLHYLERGTGPLILLLHGFPEYSGMWRDYLEPLGTSNHVVAPDLRGYNLSAQPGAVSEYALEKLMGDVTGLVQKLGHNKVCLVGHDWGGLLSWYVAGHHPELVSRLVILNVPHPKIYQKLYTSDKEQKKMATYVGKLLAAGSEKALAQSNYLTLQTSMFGGSTHTFDDATKAEILAAWNKGLAGPINWYRAYMPRQRELSDKLPAIKVPTLVLWGGKDTALSLKNLDGLKTHVAKLEVKRFPAATHWLTYESPDLLVPAIKTFCAGGT